MDHRDRLILALSALVRAERDARAAWDEAAAASALSPDIIDAIDTDPRALVGGEDMELAEAFVSPSSPLARARFA